jgi:hypothetical protein
MNYWIFKANPEHYRIDARLQDPYPHIIWAVTRYHERIQKDDTVFIWRAGTPRGICAVMLIDACPYEPTPEDLNDGYELPASSTAPVPEHWAKGHLINRFPIIETNVIKKIPGLELFSFFSAFQQATNFTLTRPEGSILLEFIEKYQVELRDKPRETVSKPALKPASKTGRPAPAATKKVKPAAAPARPSSEVALLKCEACGRYVVSTDTERHTREAHAGQPVEWKKMK